MLNEECIADFGACTVICGVLYQLQIWFLSFLSLLVQTTAWELNFSANELVCGYVSLWFENESGILFWIVLFFPCTAMISLVYGIDIKVSGMWDLLIPGLL